MVSGAEAGGWSVGLRQMKTKRTREGAFIGYVAVSDFGYYWNGITALQGYGRCCLTTGEVISVLVSTVRVIDGR